MPQRDGPSPASISTLQKTILDSLTVFGFDNCPNPRYKGKAFTSAETLEWQKEGAAHDMAKTVGDIGGGGSGGKS